MLYCFATQLSANQHSPTHFWFFGAVAFLHRFRNATSFLPFGFWFALHQLLKLLSVAFHSFSQAFVSIGLYIRVL